MVMELTNRLKEYRKGKGLTQQEFADKACVSPGSFHKIREIEPVLTGRFCAWYFPTKGGKYHVQNLFYS